VHIELRCCLERPPDLKFAKLRRIVVHRVCTWVPYEVSVAWLRLHDLRHACATFLVASGPSPRTVMKTLGHSQIPLTMNTYGHVLPDMERTAVDDAARRLFG
jgi:integrase